MADGGFPQGVKMYGGYHTSQGKGTYADLMSMASQNVAQAKRAANAQIFSSTSKSKPVDPKQVKLKEGVAKFLAKREEEDRKRQEMEKKKKEKLLELRQQDRKATNRVRKMLSMTKSANKSCVDDAKDCLNAAVTAQAQGDVQPDEDDYGYTSGYADMMHQKIMEKYKEMPIKPAFPQSRLNVPKPQSLTNRQTSWKNNNKPQEYDSEGDRSPAQNNHEDHASSKHKMKHKVIQKPAPPDYRQLLLIAEEKKSQPIALPTPVEEKKMEKEEFEFGRPMTAKEKKAFLAEKECKERAARRFNMKIPSDKNNNSNGKTDGSSIKDKPATATSFKIPKANKPIPPRDRDDDGERSEIPPPKKPKSSPNDYASDNKNGGAIAPSGKLNNPSSSSSSKVNGIRSSPNSSSTKPHLSKDRPMNRASPKQQSPPPHRPVAKQREREFVANQKSSNSREQTSKTDESGGKQDRQFQERMELIKAKPKYLSAFEGSSKERDVRRQTSSHDVRKMPKPSGSGRDKEVAQQSRDLKSDRGSKMKSGQSIRGTSDDYHDRRRLSHDRDRMPPRRDPPMKPHVRDDPRIYSKPNRGRAVIESDDEDYDSEMDDFIDDSEADLGHISAEIGKIFGYDKRRFEDDYESDGECMESSVGQLMREEQRSLRIGIQEDLEDMRREEEEKRLKLLKMKKRSR